MDELLKSARHLARMWQEMVISAGDAVIDATMGNGHDALALCRLVGDTGHVHAFDVQQEALTATRQRLKEAGLLSCCTLHHMGHERMAEVVAAPVRAVVFNLGWLPGGSREITTGWETTKAALCAALSLLQAGGIVTICAYPGHERGIEELVGLTAYLRQLPPQQYNVLHQRFVNAGQSAPECFVIERIGDTI